MVRLGKTIVSVVCAAGMVFGTFSPAALAAEKALAAVHQTVEVNYSSSANPGADEAGDIYAEHGSTDEGQANDAVYPDINGIVNPDHTTAHEGTAILESEAASEDSASPEDIAYPETKTVPVFSAVPGLTSAPESIAAPQETASPGSTAVPEETTSPGSTAAVSCSSFLDIRPEGQYKDGGGCSVRHHVQCGKYGCRAE